MDITSLPEKSPHIDRRHMRQLLRTRRRELSPAAQRKAAIGIAHHLMLKRIFRKAQHIALYIANDGEVDPSVLVRRALAQGKRIYLPVLHAHLPRMVFARWRPGDKLLRNRFGIPEPLPKAQRLPANKLDLVCMPMVGFDPKGNRLGMGGGFYDRTFAYRLTQRNAKPLLIGMAHHCQQVPALTTQPWDVPLDMIATDKGCLTPGNRSLIKEEEV